MVTDALKMQIILEPLIDDMQGIIKPFDEALSRIADTFRQDIVSTFTADELRSMGAGLTNSKLTGDEMASLGAGAVGPGASLGPEILAALLVISAAMLVIQFILDTTLSGITKLVDAFYGPIMDGLLMIIDIIAAPFKVLGAFFLSLIIPFFQVATQVSHVLLTFFQSFMNKYNEAFMRRSAEAGMGGDASSLGAIQEGAMAEAMTYMFGSVIVAMDALWQNLMLGVAESIIMGFAEILGGFIEFMTLGQITAEQVATGAQYVIDVMRANTATTVQEQMENVEMVSKMVGDAYQILRESTLVDLETLIGDISTDFQTETGNVQAAVADMETNIATGTDEFVTGLEEDGDTISTSASTLSGWFDMTTNSVSKPGGLKTELDNLTSSASFASGRLSSLGLAVAGALREIREAGGKGAGSKTTFNFALASIGSNNQLNLGSPEVTS